MSPLRYSLLAAISALLLLASCSKKGADSPTNPAATHTVDLVSPVSNSTNIPTNETFTCGGVPGALLYTFNFSPAGNVSSSRSISQTSVTSSVTIASLVSGETYTWSVRVGTQDSGTYSSPSWTFFVGTGSTGGVPTLSLPSPYANNVCTSPTLSWTAVPGAAAYDLEISQAYGVLVHSHTVSGTSYTIPAQILSSSTQYSWRVAVSGTGQFSGSSFFSTVNAPAQLTPPNNNATSSAMPTLTWSSLPCTASYVVDLSTRSDFSSIYRSQTVSGTSYTASNLSTGLHYYWRVRDADAISYSGTWSFYY